MRVRPQHWNIPDEANSDSDAIAVSGGSQARRRGDVESMQSGDAEAHQARGEAGWTPVKRKTRAAAKAQTQGRHANTAGTATDGAGRASGAATGSAATGGTATDNAGRAAADRATTFTAATDRERKRRAEEAVADQVAALRELISQLLARQERLQQTVDQQTAEIQAQR